MRLVPCFARPGLISEGIQNSLLYCNQYSQSLTVLVNVRLHPSSLIISLPDLIWLIMSHNSLWFPYITKTTFPYQIHITLVKLKELSTYWYCTLFSHKNDLSHYFTKLMIYHKDNISLSNTHKLKGIVNILILHVLFSSS